jgi:hypothetical protein
MGRWLQVNNFSKDPCFNHQQLITIDSRPNIAHDEQNENCDPIKAI